MHKAAGNGKSKKKVISTVILVIILALLFVRFVIFSDTYKYNTVVRTVDEVNNIIDTAISQGKGEIYFTSSFPPKFIDFDDILQRNTANGNYDGCELYALRYEYAPCSEGYEVHVHLSEPSLYASFMAERRVKKIASKFEDLNDYEKIKGVHDYLVLLNRYVAFEGGAYSALCKGRSSCTGYAFAFYAIMRELGVPVTIEIGGNHAWNTVQYEGKWYNIDVTWDDPGVQEISYTYFMKCNKDFPGHAHYGSDAESSIEPEGKSALYYYGLVPNYNLIDDIILISIFVIPVAILAIYLLKKKKKEAPITEGKVMEVGSWSFLMPMETAFSFEVIRKMSTSPMKKDIWGWEDGKYFHLVDNEDENIHERLEINAAQFFDELDFVLSICRANNRMLGDALLRARQVLETGTYKPGDYMGVGRVPGAAPF
ncbi:MAG: hypothetical protein IK007_09030 [Lachnospiraceae bacterium]|nr:hypothetical protein [Lachnospiraceae bacterium]